LKNYLLYICFLFCYVGFGQSNFISGKVTSNGKPVEFVAIYIPKLGLSTSTDSLGKFNIKGIKPGEYKIEASIIGYDRFDTMIKILGEKSSILEIELKENSVKLDEIVVTGTMKEVSRSASPVAIEVLTPALFRKNPTPSIYDALQNVNGVRPQVNCSVCNTGDIHINGLEGPYTMVLIDGMPIVSALSTVYGLSGIPNSIVDRIEIVKGPASSLYGSEAVGGLINIITKKHYASPQIALDLFGTSWGEVSGDLSFKNKLGSKINMLTGVNVFGYTNRIDKNLDNFTDVATQKRISIFQKLSLNHKSKEPLTLAWRYLNEDRFGGEMQWQENDRGGDEVYGENIKTERWEIISSYKLPTTEKLNLSISLNGHHQDSYYGTTPFIAQQNIAFGQLLWDKTIARHDLLMGFTYRYTFYLDNTPASGGIDNTVLGDRPSKTFLPGIFGQYETKINANQTFLAGLRYDYNSNHGHITTPRLAYKWSINDENILRFNFGTGFRVVNLFTEDHASLTGAREVVILEDLNPERSYNFNVNYVKKIYARAGNYFSFDASVFYTYFNNRIVPDYETNANLIIYSNLDGNAQSKGISLNFDAALTNGWKILTGFTTLSNTITSKGETTQQLLAERFSTTWTITYTTKNQKLDVDYTGNLYSPMLLPLSGDLDPRPSKSPWWSTQNIQVTFRPNKKLQIYGGVKNILDWTPTQGIPFLIARANDPFDKNVRFGPTGQIVPTSDNPYGLSFDPTYIYAPNQGSRLFLGVRYSI
jgi:outer membrane receptor for ferrienterochelin and colicins